MEIVNNIDITEFMTWWITEFLRIWDWIINLLDSIKFAGTSLLGVIIIVIFLTAGLPIILELTRTHNQTIQRSERNKYKGAKEK